MAFDIWLAFVLASFVLVIIPGPTVMLTVSYALSQGRRIAIATAAGVALGDLLAMSASLAGLGALVQTSATLFTILKWVGAIYLIYVGIRLLRSPVRPLTPEAETPPTDARAVFWHATAVTALNPKSIGFFIAFVPQFLRPDAPLLPQFAILIASFVALGFANALTYALLADRMRRQIKRPAVLLWINRIGGGALISLGALTANLKRA